MVCCCCEDLKKYFVSEKIHPNAPIPSTAPSRRETPTPSVAERELSKEVLDLLKPGSSGAPYWPLKFQEAITQQHRLDAAKLVPLWSYMKSQVLGQLSKLDKADILYRCESYNCQDMREY